MVCCCGAVADRIGDVEMLMTARDGRPDGERC